MAKEYTNSFKKAKASTSGMTLVEVIIAITILGVGLTAFLTATSKCLTVIKISKNYQTAQWVLGQGELDYPLIVTNELEDMEVGEESYLDGFIFSRTVDEEDEIEDGLYVVRTRVSWMDRNSTAYEETLQYVYIPLEEDEE